MRNKHTGYCAPCRLVFSIIVSKSEPPSTLHPKSYTLSAKPKPENPMPVRRLLSTLNPKPSLQDLKPQTCHLRPSGSGCHLVFWWY